MARLAVTPAPESPDLWYRNPCGVVARNESRLARRRSVTPLRAGSRLREGRGKVEAAEGVWVEEGRDLLNLRAAQGKHVDGTRREGLCLVVPGVGAERELPICPSRLEAPAHRPAQHSAAEEDCDLFAAAVPGWQGRHGQLGVFGQHGDDRGDVVALPRNDVALHDLSQRSVAQ